MREGTAHSFPSLHSRPMPYLQLRSLFCRMYFDINYEREVDVFGTDPVGFNEKKCTMRVRTFNLHLRISSSNLSATQTLGGPYEGGNFRIFSDSFAASTRRFSVQNTNCELLSWEATALTDPRKLDKQPFLPMVSQARPTSSTNMFLLVSRLMVPAGNSHYASMGRQSNCRWSLR